VVSQTADLSLDEVMAYELSPYPPSLFEAKHLLRKPNKAQLMAAIKELSADDAVLKDVPEVEHYVFDGVEVVSQPVSAWITSSYLTRQLSTSGQ